MIGKVDEQSRALLELNVRRTANGEDNTVVAWIDTAFDGHLVLSSKLIADLNLESLVETEAVLADGSKVVLESYVCYLNWFGETIPVQVISNDGVYPLLGTGLLVERILHIDYKKKELTLN